MKMIVKNSLSSTIVMMLMLMMMVKLILCTSEYHPFHFHRPPTDQYIRNHHHHHHRHHHHHNHSTYKPNEKVPSEMVNRTDGSHCYRFHQPNPDFNDNYYYCSKYEIKDGFLRVNKREVYLCEGERVPDLMYPTVYWSCKLVAQVLLKPKTFDPRANNNPNIFCELKSIVHPNYNNNYNMINEVFECSQVESSMYDLEKATFRCYSSSLQNPSERECHLENQVSNHDRTTTTTTTRRPPPAPPTLYTPQHPPEMYNRSDGKVCYYEPSRGSPFPCPYDFCVQYYNCTEYVLIYDKTYELVEEYQCTLSRREDYPAWQCKKYDEHTDLVTVVPPTHPPQPPTPPPPPPPPTDPPTINFDPANTDGLVGWSCSLLSERYDGQGELIQYYQCYSSASGTPQFYKCVNIFTYNRIGRIRNCYDNN